MNKKVLIDKQALIDELMKIPGVGSNSDALKTIKRFPSYEPQKVKVPAAIGKHIKKRKADGDNFHESILATNSQIYEWYMENAELYEQAWFNGYEVEEEPQWTIKIGSEHLTGLQFIKNGKKSDVQFFTNGQKKMYFSDESKAEAVALLVDGSVEEV